MSNAEFQRARSASAKQSREQAILDAARSLAAERGIRDITLTELADAIGMHKSALLRYFETREQIFLVLTAGSWREWSAEIRARLAGSLSPDAAAAALAETLTARPMFCDLLAHAPLNLERNVSVEAVREFKLAVLAEVAAVTAALHSALGLSEEDAGDVVSAATSLAGALWQMATPGPEIAALYRADSRLGHALIDVRARLESILAALIAGFLARRA